MKKFLLFLFVPVCGISQIPEYYNTIDFNQTGNALKDQLNVLVTNTQTVDLEYTPGVWDALKVADLDPDNPQNVLLIYGYDDTDQDTDNDRSRDKDLSCHTSSCAGLWVREHTYPRSIGTPNLGYEGPGSDPHHLRAIDYSMNGQRSNKLFADSEGTAQSVAGGYWYPGDEWKGDIARMMMFMYLRYTSQCLANNVGTGSNSYNMDMPDIFLEWNEEDPVSAFEMNRNNVIQDVQGNRNPFIDNPYLATVIWGGPDAQDTWSINSTEIVNADKLVVYPTVTTGIVHIENRSSSVYNYEVYSMVGQKVSSGDTVSDIDITGKTAGIYILTIKTADFSESFKIILN